MPAKAGRNRHRLYQSASETCEAGPWVCNGGRPWRSLDQKASPPLSDWGGTDGFLTGRTRRNACRIKWISILFISQYWRKMRIKKSILQVQESCKNNFLKDLCGFLYRAKLVRFNGLCMKFPSWNVREDSISTKTEGWERGERRLWILYR